MKEKTIERIRKFTEERDWDQFPICPKDFVNKQVHLPVLLLYAADHTLYHSIENTPTTLLPQSQSILQDLPDYEIDPSPSLL